MTVLRKLEQGIMKAEDLSELGNALFRAGDELMNGDLTQGEYERLRELGTARRAALIKKLRMEGGIGNYGRA